MSLSFGETKDLNIQQLLVFVNLLFSETEDLNIQLSVLVNLLFSEIKDFNIQQLSVIVCVLFSETKDLNIQHEHLLLYSLILRRRPFCKKAKYELQLECYQGVEIYNDKIDLESFVIESDKNLNIGVTFEVKIKK